MERPGPRTCVLAALTVLLLTAAVAVLGDFDTDRARAQSIARSTPGDPTVSASVGSSPVGQAMAPGFAGLSLEYSALEVWIIYPKTRHVTVFMPTQARDVREGESLTPAPLSRPPEPTLKVPATRFTVAITTASATSVTYTKSRLISPSPAVGPRRSRRRRTDDPSQYTPRIVSIAPVGS